MTRPAEAQCETCPAIIEIQPVGKPRRFCADCTAAKTLTRKLAWRAANPEEHRRHNRESARRRRRAGRLT